MYIFTTISWRKNNVNHFIIPCRSVFFRVILSCKHISSYLTVFFLERNISSFPRVSSNVWILNRGHVRVCVDTNLPYAIKTFFFCLDIFFLLGLFRKNSIHIHTLYIYKCVHSWRIQSSYQDKQKVYRWHRIQQVLLEWCLKSHQHIHTYTRRDHTNRSRKRVAHLLVAFFC